ncbi:MAG: putative sugar O-methyltransferase [Desulfovibrionaceae bacterium]
MKDSIAMMKTMLEDQNKQSGLYHPGPYWAGYQKRTVLAVERNGLDDFRNCPAIGKGFVDVSPRDPWDLVNDPNRWKHRLLRLVARLPKVRSLVKEYRQLVDLYANRSLHYTSLYYQSAFGQACEEALEGAGWPDSLHGGCQDIVTVNGERVAAIYVHHLMRLVAFKPYVDFSAKRCAMEIGGGFGSVAHLLLHLNSGIRKFVYLDIPPMICIATEYLRHHFGEAVRDYSETRALDRITFSDDDTLEILCLCPWQIESLTANVDLFLNFASFSEMPQEVVQNYVEHLKRLCLPEVDLCLLFNKNKEKAGTTPLASAVAIFSPDFELTPFDAEISRGLYHGRRR